MFVARYTAHCIYIITKTNERYRGANLVLTDDENHVVRPPAQVFPDRLSVVHRGDGVWALAAAESDGRAPLQLHLRLLYCAVIALCSARREAGLIKYYSEHWHVT